MKKSFKQRFNENAEEFDAIMIEMLEENDKLNTIQYQSEVSGLWYDNIKDAGDIKSIKLDNVLFIKTTETFK